MTPEGRVKADIKKVLREYGVWWYMPVQNGMGRVGIPDFICCLGGEFLAIEAKAYGKANTLTPNQVSIMNEIVTSGGTHLVIDDVDHLKLFLATWRKRHEKA